MTIKMWREYQNRVPFRKAFVVQDGHAPEDVPHEAYAVFVGGSTQWKLDNAERFKSGVTQTSQGDGIGRHRKGYRQQHLVIHGEQVSSRLSR